MRARVSAKLRGDRRDVGTTLVELLITMILMAVVSTLVVTAVVQVGRIVTHNDDEEIGLNDAKTILDRLGRDVREARGVECDGGTADGNPVSVIDPADTYCKAHLQLWVDSNSDYVRQPTEVITWRLELNPDTIHHDVWRIVGTGAGAPAHREASSLIVDAVFSYDTPSNTNPKAAQRVDTTLSYDAIVGRGAGARTVAFSARLRNKG